MRSCGRSANRISLIRHTRPGESRRRTGENRPRIAQVDSTVDAARELAAHLLVGRDPARPRHHHRVSCAAEVAGHLLAPLEWGVVGVGPGCGEVWRGVIAAESLDAPVLLDQRELVFGVEVHPVQKCHLFERPGEGSFHAGAVVAPDVEDQRVVEVTEVLDGVEKPADVPVGVLREPRRRLPSGGRRAFSGHPRGCPMRGTALADQSVRVLVTDKLRSYQVAHRAVMPSVEHRQSRYLNNRAENSHQPTRQRERAMKRFRTPRRSPTVPGGVQRDLPAFPAPPPSPHR